MKKTLMTCLAVLAVFAIASSAAAVTCTIDQRPAATLLVPYFQVSYDARRRPRHAPASGARDTIVTIVNASSAPMIAHVNVYDRQSIIRARLQHRADAVSTFSRCACRTSSRASCRSTSNSDRRRRLSAQSGGVGLPGSRTASSASSRWPRRRAWTTRRRRPSTTVPAFDFDLAEPAPRGLQRRSRRAGDRLHRHRPRQLLQPVRTRRIPCTSTNDAIGMENNLWGEIIFTSGHRHPDLRACRRSTSRPTRPSATPPSSIRRPRSGRSTPATGIRSRNVFCTNCGSGDPETDLSISAPWDVGFGDQREPLGLKWAARWFDAGAALITTFRVWRSSPAGGDCDVEEPTVTLNVLRRRREHDRRRASAPRRARNPTFNFPLRDAAAQHHGFRASRRRGGRLG